MASYIFEFFGYRSEDQSSQALSAAANEKCPFIQDICEKTFSDGTISGVCSIRQATSKMPLSVVPSTVC